MCVFQSSAIQTACHVWGPLMIVRAAGTQKPSFISAAVCPSVQLATTLKDEYVQVGVTFNRIHQNSYSKLSLISQLHHIYTADNAVCKYTSRFLLVKNDINVKGFSLIIYSLFLLRIIRK